MSKSKIKAVSFIVALFAVTAVARLAEPFHSWQYLQNETPCILIARCGSWTPPVPNVGIINAPRSDVKILVRAVLKGTNTLGIARLQTNHKLREGEYYLAFANFHDGIFDAYEDYRVVPLGEPFGTNLIAGKSLEEQIRTLLQRSAAYLDHEIQEQAEEKRRIEDGLSAKSY